MLHQKRPRSPESSASPGHFFEWRSVDSDSVLLRPPTADMVRRSCTWERHGVDEGKEERTAVIRLAAFDMDDTLIRSRSGKVFATKGDAGDWKFSAATVQPVLQRLHAAGYLVVLFTNQAGLTDKQGVLDRPGVAALQEKIRRVGEALGIPLAAVVSTRKGRWRKPGTPMWELMEELIRQELMTSLSDSPHSVTEAFNVECRRDSFYCGDAAGRLGPTLCGRKKDFSCADRKFAHNIGGLFFCVPEMLFDSAAGGISETELLTNKADGPPRLDIQKLQLHPAAHVTFTWCGVDPAWLKRLPMSYAGLTLSGYTFPNGARTTLNIPDDMPLGGLQRADKRQELVLLVGFPGCGKSTFYRRFFESLGYTHVNRDTLRSKEKCLSATAAAWAAGRSVVVDNTNPSSAVRREYIHVIARSEGKSDGALPVRVFVFQHSMEESMHWNEVRTQAGLLDSKVPVIAYYTFKKQFEPYSESLIREERVEVVYEVPPVACFDGLPPNVKECFYRLYES